MKTAIKILLAVLMVCAFGMPNLRIPIFVAAALLTVVLMMRYTLTTHDKVTGKRIGFVFVMLGLIMTCVQVIYFGSCSFQMVLIGIGLALYLTEKNHIMTF